MTKGWILVGLQDQRRAFGIGGLAHRPVGHRVRRQAVIAGHPRQIQPWMTHDHETGTAYGANALFVVSVLSVLVGAARLLTHDQGLPDRGIAVTRELDGISCHRRPARNRRHRPPVRLERKSGGGGASHAPGGPGVSPRKALRARPRVGFLGGGPELRAGDALRTRSPTYKQQRCTTTRSSKSLRRLLLLLLISMLMLILTCVDVGGMVQALGGGDA